MKLPLLVFAMNLFHSTESAAFTNQQGLTIFGDIEVWSLSVLGYELWFNIRDNEKQNGLQSCMKKLD